MKHTTPVIKLNQPDDNYKFQPLPKPSGEYPYHLPIDKVLPGMSDNTMTFHMLGDTGATSRPEFQQYVVAEMVKQYQQGQFIYHLGDLVYHYGEAEQYEQQFFLPYNNYMGPVFAIAGNHDSDVNPGSVQPYKSLDAFTKVFCDTEPRNVAFNLAGTRKSMVQPNVYWTLDTPLATIIGLQSNVPKYGIITTEQQEWFKEELKKADAGKLLIVCLHHAPYSADVNHGSSLPMIELLENAFTATRVRPDIVFSGHVHNYQRFNKQYNDGITIPFIVAGAGGFDELHAVADMTDERFTSSSPAFAGVTLENFCDTNHGFLRINITKANEQLMLNGEYFILNAESEYKAVLRDSFNVKKTMGTDEAAF
jgi:predicted phosphodiesterase